MIWNQLLVPLLALAAVAYAQDYSSICDDPSTYSTSCDTGISNAMEDKIGLTNLLTFDCADANEPEAYDEIRFIGYCCCTTNPVSRCGSLLPEQEQAIDDTNGCALYNVDAPTPEPSPLPSPDPVTDFSPYCQSASMYDSGCDDYFLTKTFQADEFSFNCSEDVRAEETQIYGFCCCDNGDVNAADYGVSRCGALADDLQQDFIDNNRCVQYDGTVDDSSSGSTPGTDPYAVPAGICASASDALTEDPFCIAAWTASLDNPSSPFYLQDANRADPLLFDCQLNNAADEELDSIGAACCGSGVTRCGDENWAKNCEVEGYYTSTAPCSDAWALFDVSEGLDSTTLDCGSLSTDILYYFNSIAVCCCIDEAGESANGRCGPMSEEDKNQFLFEGGCSAFNETVEDPDNWANICEVPADFDSLQCDGIFDQYFGPDNGQPCTDFFGSETFCSLDPLTFDCDAYPDEAVILETWAQTCCGAGSNSRCGGIAPTPSQSPSVDPSPSPSPVDADGCFEGACPWHSVCGDAIGSDGDYVCNCLEEYPEDVINFYREGTSFCCQLPNEDCKADEFKCDNGLCIKSAFRCNGADECSDNSDEASCFADPFCPPDTFKCDNGNCVSSSQVCSGSNNCGDDSDEANCAASPCPAGTWACATPNGFDTQTCISESFVCDFNKQCEDGSDEATDVCFPEIGTGCADFLFDCQLGPEESAQFASDLGLDPLPNGLTLCVPGVRACNGATDCPTGADEDPAVADCRETCVPNCIDQVCGSDNCCGGQCGGEMFDSSCNSDEYCSSDGVCTCRPDCPVGSVCGDDDGCGGKCQGTCPDNGGMRDECQPGGFCAPVIGVESEDVPKIIGSGDNQVVVSTLEVIDNGIVRDVNVIGLRGTHDVYGEVRMTLESPYGTVVEIVSRLCTTAGLTAFDFSLDDDADGPQACPPTSASDTFLPSFPLSDFVGEDVTGSWKLTVIDSYADNGGVLEGWGLRIALCEPMCDGKSCGDDDSCGGFCENDTGCQASEMCGTIIGVNQGVCICRPDCDGKQCGEDDGCPGPEVCIVQTCAEGSQCRDGLCDIPNYASSDVPVFLDSSQDSLHRSVLEVPEPSRTILSINVENLKGTHTNMGDLTLMLRSPEGTLVEIMSPRCLGSSNFDLNLDSEADPGNWPCPPTDGGTYLPSNPLTAFNGEGSAGVWELLAYDNNDQDGGRLDAWSLSIETCLPSCDGKSCGDLDGCGGLCQVTGTCTEASEECIDGVCVCNPDCSSATKCGDDDGCGGACIVQTCGDIETLQSLPSNYLNQQCTAEGSCAHPVYPSMGEVFRSGVSFTSTSTISVSVHPDAVVGGRPGNDGIFYSGGVQVVNMAGLFVDGIYNMRLTSPAGTTVDLTAMPDSTGQSAWNLTTCRTGFTGLSFTEEALNSIECPPIYPPYMSNETLASFDGEPVDGDWVLEITGQPGELAGWSLDIAVCMPNCGMECLVPDGCGGLCRPEGVVCPSETPRPSSSPSPAGTSASPTPWFGADDGKLCNDTSLFTGGTPMTGLNDCNYAVGTLESNLEEAGYDFDAIDCEAAWTFEDINITTAVVEIITSGYCCCGGWEELSNGNLQRLYDGISKCGGIEQLQQLPGWDDNAFNDSACDQYFVEPSPLPTIAPPGPSVENTLIPFTSPSGSPLPTPDEGEAVGTACVAIDTDCALCDTNAQTCKLCSSGSGKVVSSDGSACLNECGLNEREIDGVCKAAPPAYESPEKENWWIYVVAAVGFLFVVCTLYIVCGRKKKKEYGDEDVIVMGQGEVVEGNANADVPMDTLQPASSDIPRESFENDMVTTGLALDDEHELDDDDDDDDYEAHETAADAGGRRKSVNVHSNPRSSTTIHAPRASTGAKPSGADQV